MISFKLSLTPNPASVYLSDRIQLHIKTPFTVKFNQRHKVTHFICWKY